MLFVTTGHSHIRAFEAASGKLLWEYDGGTRERARIPLHFSWGNKGLAYAQGRLVLATTDGFVVALDAKSGREIWKTRDFGPDEQRNMNGAPRIFGDKVIVGHGGADVSAIRGWVSAYELASGKLAWRFHTVPGDPSQPAENRAMEIAAPTWKGDWYGKGGGGTAWNAFSYDPALNLVYIGVGNGFPYAHRKRSPGGGDNLFLASIVAVDADSGAYRWHYQVCPAEQWDCTATQDMTLATVEIGGKTRKVLMQAPKNGFFYVLDRETGEFLSAEAYVPITWASHVDPETGRPVENPGADYAEKPALTMPAPYGGHNWHPMTYSPSTNLVYIPALDLPFMYGQDNAFRYNPATWNTGVEFALTIPPESITEEVALRAMVKGHLAAWDPVAQREVWRVQHSGSWNGGLLSTSGDLLFQGRADGVFAAYQASTGALLWETPVHTGVIAAPVTWAVDGEQYVTVVAGWGGAFGVASGIPAQDGNVIRGGRILTYKLGATGSLPTPPMPEALPTPPPMTASADTVDQGELLYHQNCSVCHGGGAVSSGVLPDLRYMDEQTHQIFQGIVLGGAYKEKGMVSFSHVLDSEGAAAIHAYLIKRGHDAIEERRLLAEQSQSDSAPAGG